MLSIMHDLVLDDSQFVIATHSPILLAYPGASIYQLGAHGATETAYEDTEHFRVTLDFLNRYPSMLRTLLQRDNMPAE